jgi:prepilin-type N-terminal cleavage/methylation domain-containing protein
MRISRSRRRSTAGFTFIELLVSLTLLAGVSLYLFQAFISGMMHAGRAN